MLALSFDRYYMPTANAKIIYSSCWWITVLFLFLHTFFQGSMNVIVLENFSSSIWVTYWRNVIFIVSGIGLRWHIMSWERFTKARSWGMCWFEWLSHVRVELNSIKGVELFLHSWCLDPGKGVCVCVCVYSCVFRQLFSRYVSWEVS